jgi:3'-5' exoribonuclease
MIHERISAIPGFPMELAMLLKHMILSHHGQYDFGSPKRPKTIEATILNYLDDLDSKINGIRTHIRKEPANQSRWTSYHRLYDRYFYKDSYISEEERSEPALEPENDIPQVVEESPADLPESASFRNSPFEQLQGKNLELF